MQKLLNVVVWLLVGVCVATMTYNLLERDSLNNRLADIQTTKNVIQAQNVKILEIVE